jgi:cell division protein FtsN
VTQYWIQAGSFASRSRAEQTQTALSDKGINARLTSVDVSGTTFFRVRIGPYDAKPEAEKFLDWIKEIDTFGSSYISEVYTTRTVN